MRIVAEDAETLGRLVGQRQCILDAVVANGQLCESWNNVDAKGMLGR